MTVALSSLVILAQGIRCSLLRCRLNRTFTWTAENITSSRAPLALYMVISSLVDQTHQSLPSLEDHDGSISSLVLVFYDHHILRSETAYYIVPIVELPAVVELLLGSSWREVFEAGQLQRKQSFVFLSLDTSTPSYPHKGLELMLSGVLHQILIQHYLSRGI